MKRRHLSWMFAACTALAACGGGSTGGPDEGEAGSGGSQSGLAGSGGSSGSTGEGGSAGQATGGSSAGTGGSAGTGNAGSGGTGTGGTNGGPVGVQVRAMGTVPAGAQMSSGSYRLTLTGGEAPGGNSVASSGNFKLKSGLVGLSGD